MTEVKIDIPADWTENDLRNFLKYINTDHDKKVTTRSFDYPNCNGDKPCRFWQQTGKESYQGECKLGSVSCITAVFNHEKPSRWMAKD